MATPQADVRAVLAASSAARPGSGNFLYVRKKQRGGGYKTVAVHRSKLTTAQVLAALRNGLNNGARAPIPAKPPTAANPAKPATVGPPPKPNKPAAAGYAWKLINNRWVQVLIPVDPRDSNYQREMAQAAFDRSKTVAELEAERSRLPSMYNRGAADIRTAYDRDRYDSNAELAARGIIQSGEYQKRGADRLMQQARQTSDLDRQYGSGAQSQIAARLAEVNQQFNLNKYSSLQGAKDRYSERYPASQYIWASIQ